MLTNQRVVLSEKGQRIIRAISDYQNLKGIFTEFKEGFEEKYKDECLIDQSSNDVVIEFSTPFDSIALIRFSMVYASANTAFGRILFERCVDDRRKEEKNEPIWELYFDGERKLKENILDNEPLDYLFTGGNCEHLLADLLDRLLQLPCFQAPTEFPEE
jgi:hypothetical protein